MGSSDSLRGVLRRSLSVIVASTERAAQLGDQRWKGVLRAGLHTGEVELRGPDVGGIAVHIGARVSQFADPSEVLVSRTVTDLVAGSGLEFDDRGEHALKGISGDWRLFSVRG